MTISQLFVDARARIGLEPTDELEEMAHRLGDAEAYVDRALAAQSGPQHRDFKFASIISEEIQVAQLAPSPAAVSDRRTRAGGVVRKFGNSDRVQKVAEAVRNQDGVKRAQVAIASAQNAFEKSQNAVTKAQAMTESAQALLASTQIRVADKWTSTMHPANPAWDSLSAEARVTWWYRRFAPAAALVAATPALAGPIGAKSHLGELIGAASQAVLISAIAWEAGVEDPVRHTQVSAKLLLRRQVSEAELTAVVASARLRAQELRAAPLAEVSVLPKRLESVKLVWQSAKEMSEMEALLNRRPRGSIVARQVRKVPALGVGGAYVAELGGLRKTLRKAVEEFS